MTDSNALLREKTREPTSVGGPTFAPENQVDLAPVCGIDEAGRGPLAGPVVAAAVILDRDNFPGGLDDSKKLTEQRREELYEALCECAQVSIGMADIAEIDTMNILQASLLAMTRACEALPETPKFALIDGIHAPKLACPTACLKGGDGKSLSIAAASIIAKVTRDRLMRALGLDYPGYGWERNKGYGSAEHLAALKKLGPTPHHRTSFAPVKEMLG